MRVYGQIIWETGSVSNPSPDQYKVWDSIGEAKRDLERCVDHPFLDASEGVTMLIWKGEPDPDDLYPCDMSHHFPDKVYELGPRGGIVLTG